MCQKFLQMTLTKKKRQKKCIIREKSESMSGPVAEEYVCRAPKPSSAHENNVAVKEKWGETYAGIKSHLLCKKYPVKTTISTKTS